MSAVGVSTSVLPAALTDELLVGAVRAGDDGAFEELWRRYNRRVAAFVVRILRDPGRAEDVTQDAFVSALRRLRATENPIHFKPWIYEIARNGAIDQHRRVARAQEVSVDGELPAADQGRLAVAVAPEAEAIARERLNQTWGALHGLAPSQRRIIVLRELEGLSYRQIGKRLGLSQAAVESALFRARRQLRHEYAELDAGRGSRRRIGLLPGGGLLATLPAKAVAVLASAALVGGGGAAIGGFGPLAGDRNDPDAAAPRRAPIGPAEPRSAPPTRRSPAPGPAHAPRSAAPGRGIAPTPGGALPSGRSSVGSQGAVAPRSDAPVAPRADGAGANAPVAGASLPPELDPASLSERVGVTVRPPVAAATEAVQELTGTATGSVVGILGPPAP